MKLKNDSRYPTRTLRSIITAAYRYIARTEGPYHKWYRTTIRIRRRVIKQSEFKKPDGTFYNYNNNTSGYAYLDGTLAMLKLPCPIVDVESVAWVAWHEIYHLYGYRHRAFPPHPSDDRWKALLAKFPKRISEKPVVKKPAPDRRHIRLERTVESIDRWNSKLRRAERALRKLRARRKYYEKQLGVAAAKEKK